MKNSYKPAEIEILKSLKEHGPGTFGEVVEKAKKSRPACNQALKSLVEKGDIEKYYDKERDKKAYRLTKKGADPKRSAIFLLDEIDPEVKIDGKEGEKLLSDEVVKAILDISNLAWSSKYGGIYSKQNPPEELLSDSRDELWEGFRDDDFNEYVLLKALARYNVEAKNAPHSKDHEFYVLGPTGEGYLTSHLPRPINVNLPPDRYAEWVLENMLLATKIVRDKGLLEEFDRLLLWIRPLIQAKKTKEYFEERGDPWNVISPTKENLAAKVLEKEEREYYWILEPLWEKKAKKVPTLPKKGQENFGELREGYYDKVDEYPENEEKIFILEKRGLTPPKSLKKEYEEKKKEVDEWQAWNEVNFQERYEKHLRYIGGSEISSILDSFISGEKIRLIGKEKDPPAPRFALIKHMKENYTYPEEVFPKLPSPDKEKGGEKTNG